MLTDGSGMGDQVLPGRHLPLRWWIRENPRALTLSSIFISVSVAQYAAV